MFQVSSELYDEIAIRLREAFGGGGFYSGSVECAVGETLCRLTASLVLYRSDDRWPEGCRRRLTDVVPVWWEFHTVTADGEVLNDFRSPNCGPACSCSLIGEGRCSRSGSDGSRPSPSVPCSRPARPYRGAPGPMKPVPVQTARRGRRPEGLPPAASTSGRGCRIFIPFAVEWRSSDRAVLTYRPVRLGMPAAECLVSEGSDVEIKRCGSAGLFVRCVAGRRLRSASFGVGSVGETSARAIPTRYG